MAKKSNKKTREIVKDDLRRFVFTTKKVEEITDMMNDGVDIPRYQNPWFKGEVGVRRHGISFSFSDEELKEFIKCATDVSHFAEEHCKVKREDGTVGPIKLRDYQKDILELYDKNRFSILCGSRQIGKCVTFNTIIELEDGRNISIGELYYQLLSTIQKLTILQKTKLSIYRLITKLR